MIRVEGSQEGDSIRSGSSANLLGLQLLCFSRCCANRRRKDVIVCAFLAFISCTWLKVVRAGGGTDDTKARIVCETQELIQACRKEMHARSTET